MNKYTYNLISINGNVWICSIILSSSNFYMLKLTNLLQNILFFRQCKRFNQPNFYQFMMLWVTSKIILKYVNILVDIIDTDKKINIIKSM